MVLKWFGGPLIGRLQLQHSSVVNVSLALLPVLLQSDLALGPGLPVARQLHGAANRLLGTTVEGGNKWPAVSAWASPEILPKLLPPGCTGSTTNSVPVVRGLILRSVTGIWTFIRMSALTHYVHKDRRCCRGRGSWPVLHPRVCSLPATPLFLAVSSALSINLRSLATSVAALFRTVQGVSPRVP